VLLTLGFGFYVANFGNYGATYGSLSAVIVLLTWLYLSSYVLLFGAEFNSEIEHQTARDTTAGAPQPLGQRGAWTADHVAGEPDAQPAPPQVTADAPAVAPNDPPRTSAIHAYAASRVGARAARLGGAGKVGMVSSLLATAGLGLLRRRGKTGAGAALLASAAGLALLRRD
jgi:membrane protein